MCFIVFSVKQIFWRITSIALYDRNMNFHNVHIFFVERFLSSKYTSLIVKPFTHVTSICYSFKRRMLLERGVIFARFLYLERRRWGKKVCKRVIPRKLLWPYKNILHVNYWVKSFVIVFSFTNECKLPSYHRGNKNGTLTWFIKAVWSCVIFVRCY